MTYKETLDYLYRQLPMYQRKGKQAFKKDLKNIKLLCSHFGNPQTRFPSIHIAGTNGKGTVAHMLCAVFQSAGLKVGLYTSPHYKDFRERIKVNGSYISKRKVSRFTKSVKQQIEVIRPSFFEITVAMAFTYFEEEQVDIAIIETGLGGRLDSTNVITPKLSVITNISMDHQSMLGNTIKKIAKEKAGIIKRDVSVLVGERQADTIDVFTKTAAKKSSRIYFADQLSPLKKSDLGKGPLSNPYLKLNARTVRAAVSIWNLEKLGKHISQKTLSYGIKNFRSVSNYIGRWHVINQKPLTIADSAHNEGGVSLLINQLLKFSEAKKLHFIFGFVKDKPLDKVLDLFPKKASYYFCQAKIPRALSSKDLKSQAASYNLAGRDFKSVKGALRSAKSLANPADTIVVCGSIFVVAEIL